MTPNYRPPGLLLTEVEFGEYIESALHTAPNKLALDYAMMVATNQMTRPMHRPCGTVHQPLYSRGPFGARVLAVLNENLCTFHPEGLEHVCRACDLLLYHVRIGA